MKGKAGKAILTHMRAHVRVRTHTHTHTHTPLSDQAPSP